MPNTIIKSRTVQLSDLEIGSVFIYQKTFYEISEIEVDEKDNINKIWCCPIIKDGRVLDDRDSQGFNPYCDVEELI